MNVLFEHVSWMFQQFPMKLMNVVICVLANDVFPSFDNFQTIVLGLFQALMKFALDKRIHQIDVM